MKNKVSIIIPVYNSAKYLQECLDSVLNQSYDNIEIICINDGSTDNSESILFENQKINNKIKIISKVNTGVSDSRNKGLDVSTGEYIMFLDSDDYLEKHYVEKLLSIMIKTDCELVITGYTQVKNNMLKKNSSFDFSQDFYDITFPKEIRKFFTTYEFNPCWKQLIKKSLLLNNNIKFDSSLQFGEDMLFSYNCYNQSRKTTYLMDYGYYYRDCESSAMHNKNYSKWIKYINDNLYIFDEIKKQTNKLYYDDICDKCLMNMNLALKKIMICYKHISYSKFKNIIKDIIKNYDWYLKKYDMNKTQLTRKTTYKLYLLKNKKYLSYYIILKIFILKKGR